ncbi:hypothetical protein K469DRAFT_685773 [Zopfia rhizophila CBS 207.26]|uniref:Uncharacterized protein n=1 Tax=Zopfia rhizophila CBS 207.26 TaxID=1314779 RepID=A0A6A6E9J2_9PEZI|nr:hypothetical protein K469DRAFT_685773 [Zopfia rhizophila CBS 207.26]
MTGTQKRQSFTRVTKQSLPQSQVSQNVNTVTPGTYSTNVTNLYQPASFNPLSTDIAATVTPQPATNAPVNVQAHLMFPTLPSPPPLIGQNKPSLGANPNTNANPELNSYIARMRA